MDGIIDTVAAVHPILPLLSLLKTNGKLVMVGAPEKPLELPIFPLLMGKSFPHSVHVSPQASSVGSTNHLKTLLYESGWKPGIEGTIHS